MRHCRPPGEKPAEWLIAIESGSTHRPLIAQPVMVRGSLGDVALTGSVTGTYPLYAMPVPTMLSLDRWVPHQDLRDAGKVVEMTAEMLKEKDVIFVSHQWVAFNHPDPGGEQLRALQTTINNLLTGKHLVESNFTLNSVYGTLDRFTPEMWQERLPEMFVWFDYISIPQPGAVVNAASDELKKQLDTNGDGVIEQAELVNADTTGAGKNSDHRLISAGDQRVLELVEQLKAAVDSIPSYVERSAMMWILVPPCKHHDLDGAICDFNSWRDRGWCRMEFAAGKLASGEDMPIMVIKSVHAAPEFFNPCDTFKVPDQPPNYGALRCLAPSSCCSQKSSQAPLVRSLALDVSVTPALRGARQLHRRRRPRRGEQHPREDARGQGQVL